MTGISPPPVSSLYPETAWNAGAGHTGIVTQSSAKSEARVICGPFMLTGWLCAPQRASVSGTGQKPTQAIEQRAAIGRYATWPQAGGAKPDAIAGMLGHASVTITGIHARIIEKIAENPARYLEELMGFSWTKRAISAINLFVIVAAAAEGLPRTGRRIWHLNVHEDPSPPPARQSHDCRPRWPILPVWVRCVRMGQADARRYATWDDWSP
jgi:hypothetical protein